MLLPELPGSVGTTRGEGEGECEEDGGCRSVEVDGGWGWLKRSSSGSGEVDVEPDEPPADPVLPLCADLEETIGSMDWRMRLGVSAWA